ncbi:DPP10 family protein [Megaselia abdita]
MNMESIKTEEELINSHARIRRLRIILAIIGVLLVIALIAVVVILVVFLRKEDDSSKIPSVTNSIKLEDILSGKLNSRRFNGTWINEDSILYKTPEGYLKKYNATANQMSILSRNERLNSYILHELSPDGKYVLLGKSYVKLFRHSFLAQYDILNVDTGVITELKINNNQEYLFLASWGPIGNALILNYERNLYYKSSVTAREKQLTRDKFFNGIPDWVYEEEVFSSNSAVWFSPDGNRLAFIQFDDTQTSVINIPFYGESGNVEFQYPKNRPVPYPKAGAANPFVKLFYINLNEIDENLNHFQIQVPSELNPSEHIISVVSWLDSERLCSIWMNREQNLAFIQINKNQDRQDLFRQESNSGWVDLFSEPLVNKDGSQIAIIAPQRQSESLGDYRHLTLLSTNGRKQRAVGSALTKGTFVVQALLYWDHSNNLIFFTSNAEKSNVLHVYAVKANGGNPMCITCGIKNSEGQQQSYFTADFSTGNFVVITSLGPNIPLTSVHRWSYKENNIILEKILDWERNDRLQNNIGGTKLPTTEIHEFEIGNGFTGKALISLPPNMDRSGAIKYPMLVDVYGGPDSFSVIDKFSVDWGTHLTTNQSIIYVKIDGRGSGLRGDKLLHEVYLKLGSVEIDDQIKITQALAKKLKFIDGSRIGIWGWSYGGYAAAMALAKDSSSVFKCAASVAPVTDWAYYDSIYTERFMQTPTQNPEGYKQGRLSTLATKFQNKKFLLVHGTLDDNVHYQQAMVLAKNLERADILFKQISYADEDHGLINVRPHLYHSLNRFFDDCFNL